MNLYSIKRKSDGRFFVHTNGLGDPMFSTSPIFWKTSESVHKNLKRLCSEFKPLEKIWCKRSYWLKDWTNFNPEILKAYEVVIFKVHVQGQETIPAQEYVSVPDLADMDVHIK